MSLHEAKIQLNRRFWSAAEEGRFILSGLCFTALITLANNIPLRSGDMIDIANAMTAISS